MTQKHFIMNKVYNFIKKHYYIRLYVWYAISVESILINSCGFEEIASTNPKYLVYKEKANYYKGKMNEQHRQNSRRNLR